MSTSAQLLRRGLLLEFATLGWNVLGALVIAVAALRAHSIALAGFGLDSLVEIGASLVVIWQLRGLHAGRERRALQLISIAFFLLATYVLGQAVRSLLLRLHSDPSAVGIVWLALTFGVMLALAAGKHSIGSRLGNRVLTTEARVTLIDAYLAASVLLGLVLNSWLGWWWADPVAALVIVFYGFREGRHAWREAEGAR